MKMGRIVISLVSACEGNISPAQSAEDWKLLYGRKARNIKVMLKEKFEDLG